MLSLISNSCLDATPCHTANAITMSQVHVLDIFPIFVTPKMMDLFKVMSLHTMMSNSYLSFHSSSIVFCIAKYEGRTKMTFNQRVAVVTGTSSGIGSETSLTLARNGFLTYATMRNLNKNENIKSLAEKEKLPLKILQLDVTDDGSVKSAMQSIIAEAGRIDVLVNNAGYALNGAFEDVAMEE
ncbi:MAG: SDR family NAD(P)-dependent oxidoreductase, partial [Thermoproteota archaeon]|nr:SDR family NAD(P)-dependent oxidoreductase [Thermoproteota archaeon]